MIYIINPYIFSHLTFTDINFIVDSFDFKRYIRTYIVLDNKRNGAENEK